VEEGVRATLENGVLSLIVPKKDAGSEMNRGRRVPIMQGNRSTLPRGDEKS